jgi:uncharacterized SAM-binding protein YcdF (DUF218 family)
LSNTTDTKVTVNPKVRDDEAPHFARDMRTSDRRRWIWAGGIVTVAALLAGFASDAGKLLVINEPRPSDVILVLAGETEQRPARAMQLLAQGYGKRVVMDVPGEAKDYGFTDLELAQRYVQGLPQAAAVRICPIEGLSTRDEARDVRQCLEREKSDSVLIVTSEFHTRRALSIFRRELPGKIFSVAAAYDNRQFDTHWWRHRQWAKTCVDEWMRLAWWEAVDRWR